MVQIKTIFSVLYKALFDSVVYTVIISIILGLLPNKLFQNFPLQPLKYDYQNVPENLSYWNNILVDSGELLLENQLIGAESMVEKNGLIYTGLADGRVVEIEKKTGKLRTVTRLTTDKECQNMDNTQVERCGRPLGMRWHNNLLYLVDAYQGLISLNPKTNEKQRIKLDIPDDLKGLYNDLVFDSNNNLVYITISSRRWQIDRVPWSIIDHEDTGLVIAADLATKKVVPVITGLRFPNGIDISGDNLLVAELLNFRVLKIAIKVARETIKTNKEVSRTDVGIFAKQLPGEPDNIRTHGSDVWVGLFSTRHEGKTIGDQLSTWPIVRKSLGRVFYTLSTILGFVNENIYQCHSLERWAHKLYSGHLLYDYAPKNSAVLRLDGKTGELKQFLGSNKFNSISEAYLDSEGDLWFCSFRNKFLGRLRKGKF